MLLSANFVFALEAGSARVFHDSSEDRKVVVKVLPPELAAGEYVRVLENRQGIRIACVEEIAMRMGFIDAAACHALGERQAKSGYGEYVMDVAAGFQGAT